MNHLIIEIITIALFIVYFVWSMWHLMKSAEKIYNKLYALKEKAKLAKIKDELLTVWEELKVVNNKECWHRSFSSKVVEIKTIIETKYGML